MNWALWHKWKSLRFSVEIDEEDAIVEVMTRDDPPRSIVYFSLKEMVAEIKDRIPKINWTFWRAWLPPKEIVIELDPNASLRLKAINGMLEQDISVLDYIWLIGFSTKEGITPGEPIEASKSEIKRWSNANNIWMNGKCVKWDEKVVWPVESLILFPKGKRITFL